MQFDESQKATIAEWVSEGLKLSEIQTRIQENFGVALTYMDARFLIDDLELDLKDQPKPADSDLRNAPPLPPEDDPAPVAGDGAGESSEGGVSVTLDSLYKPGAVVSGGVQFSDGQQAEWSLDQMGRLSLQTAVEGYQPPESDLQDFQQKLSSLLQKQGF